MKKVLIIIAVVLVVIQFIRIEKDNAPINPNQNYVNITHAPKQVEDILKRACYDCHSNEVKYPWYTNIAPVSWFVKDHINEGRKHLNFSEYGKYNQYQKKHIDERLAGTIERESMPLGSYLWIHKEAVLSQADKQILIDWFIQLENPESTE